MIHNNYPQSDFTRLYLDSPITVTLGNITVPHDGMYRYDIEDDIESTPLFIGNVYLESGQTECTFDLTDIARNQKWTLKSMDWNVSGETEGVVTLCRYGVKLYLDVENPATKYVGYVIHAYRYPNRKYNLDELDDLFDPNGSEPGTTCLMLQGSDSVSLLPRYPWIETPNYPFIGLWEVDPNGDDINFKISGGAFMEKSVPLTHDCWMRCGAAYKQSLEGFLSGASSDRVYAELEPNSYSGGWYQDGDSIKMESSTSYYGHGAYKHTSSTGLTPFGLVYVFSNQTYQRVTYEFTMDTQTFLRLKSYGFAIGVFPDAQSYQNPTAYVNIMPDLSEYDSSSFSGQAASLAYEIKKVQSGDTYNYEIINVQLSIPVDQSKTIKLSAGGISLKDCATFDRCPSRYYLMWQDRMGSFQSQPFNEKVKFSEDYTKVEIQDYQNNRRNINILVQPKWEINTDWMPEELYPFYESIYTSPLLLLYDTEEDTSYPVLVTGNYVEKTFKNQKKLINLTLQLEENNRQNIIY